MGSVPMMKKLSVIEGGPLDRLQLRLGLMRLEAPLIVRRALVFSLVAWLPLLIFSAVQRTLLTNVRIPFLYDPSAHIRFLLSVPLLIVAEVVIGPRIVAATSHFIASGLIREDRYQDFDAAIVDAIQDSRFYPCRSDYSRNYLLGRVSVNSVSFRDCFNLALIGYRIGSPVYFGRLLVCARLPSDLPISGLPVAVENVYLV